MHEILNTVDIIEPNESHSPERISEIKESTFIHLETLAM
jgi:hypothetical protein